MDATSSKANGLTGLQRGKGIRGAVRFDFHNILSVAVPTFNGRLLVVSTANNANIGIAELLKEGLHEFRR